MQGVVVEVFVLVVVKALEVVRIVDEVLETVFEVVILVEIVAGFLVVVVSGGHTSSLSLSRAVAPPLPIAVLTAISYRPFPTQVPLGPEITRLTGRIITIGLRYIPKHDTTKRRVLFPGFLSNVA